MTTTGNKRLAIIVLWSPLDDLGAYTDIFDNPLEAQAEAARTGRKLGHGYAVIDLATGSLPPEASDWHCALEDAVRELERLISGRDDDDIPF